MIPLQLYSICSDPLDELKVATAIFLQVALNNGGIHGFLSNDGPEIPLAVSPCQLQLSRDTITYSGSLVQTTRRWVRTTPADEGYLYLWVCLKIPLLQPSGGRDFPTALGSLLIWIR